MSSNPARLVFTPLEASNAGETYVDWRRDNAGGGMPLYLKNIEFDREKNKGFLPVLPGELISVIGRPGNGKTGFMFRWARKRAHWLKEQAERGNEAIKNSVVVYITLEQTIEELRLFHMSAEEEISISSVASGDMQLEEWENVKKGLRKLHPIPLWFIGRSMKRRNDRIDFTPENIHAALGTVEQWNEGELIQSIDSIYIDYLQKFRSNHSDFVQYYSGVTNFIKDMAQDFMTRIILGVQAKREVDQRSIPIPLMDDGQWSSTIEQFSDGVLSVTRPSHYKSEKEEFAGVVVNGKTQMILSVLKRKLGPENFKEWIYFEPRYNKLDVLEMRNIRLNEEE